MEVLNVFSGAFGDEIAVALEVLVIAGAYIMGVQGRAVVNANPCQGLPSLLVLFPSGNPLFLVRVLVHLSGRVFEKFDEIYCFWFSNLWDVFLL